VQADSYTGEVQRLLPRLLADPRINTEKAVDLLVGATSAFIRGDGWRNLSGDELLSPVSLAAAVLQRPGLTAAQRKVVLNSVIDAGHGEGLRGLFTEPEQRAFDAHVLSRAWTSNRRTVMNDFGSLLGVASRFAAAPTP
jgi:hypothetical protein